MLVVLFLILFGSTIQCLSIHKCCPRHQLLNITECIDNENATEDFFRNFEWFPFTALFNLTSNLPLNFDEKARVKELLETPGVVSDGKFSELHEYLVYAHDGMEYRKGYNFKIFISSLDEIEVLINVHPDDEHTHERDPAFMIDIDEVCLDRYVKGSFLLGVPSSKVLIQKCCSHGKMFDLLSGDCIPLTADVGSKDWTPQGTDIGYHDFGVPRWFYLCEDVEMYWTPDDYYCRGFVPPKETPIFLPDGTLLLGNETLDPWMFCSEVTVHSGGAKVKHNIILCREPSSFEGTALHFGTVYGILFIIGGVFLLLTVAISLYLPQLRLRLHNKIAITHNTVLMVAHFAWGPQFLRNDNSDSTGCSIRILVVQYSFLASLFWLNVFCINMSSTFRNTQTLSRFSRSENRRYLVYSIYAWGLPALISIFTISMEFSDNSFGIIRPGLTCFCDFSRDTFAVFVYFYGPMSVLLIFNAVLYGFTMWKIVSVHRQTAQVLSRTDSSATGSSQTDKQKLILYTKLFIVMGMTWTMEILTWLADIGDSAFSIICDILNISRPILIFIIFICKRNILISLKNEIMKATGRMNVADASERSTVTEAVSLNHFGSSRKASQDESARKLNHDR